MQRELHTGLFLLLAASTLFAAAASAVDEARLWLPRKQGELRPQLLLAARLAEGSADCEEVVSGELDETHSAAGAPVFTIVCRNTQGFTYNVRVSSAGAAGARVEKVQSLRQQEEGAARPAMIDETTARNNCLVAVVQRTAHMRKVRVQEASMRALEAARYERKYELDVDAVDGTGLGLYFRAGCRVSAGGTVLVDIRPRHVATRTTAPASPPAAAAPAGKKDAGDQGKPGVVDEDGWEVIE